MKWLGVIGVIAVLAVGSYFYIKKEAYMHEYCRIIDEEHLGWIDAADAESRANIWPEEQTRVIYLQLKLPFRTRSDDVIKIVDGDYLLYEGPDPGNQLIALRVPIRSTIRSKSRPSDNNDVKLTVVLLRRSQRLSCVFENSEWIYFDETPDGATFLIEVLDTPYLHEVSWKEVAIRQTRLR